MAVKRLGGVLRLAFVVCTASAAAACARQAPAAEQAVGTPSGSQVFARACARCHGADGGGGLPMATNGPRPIDLRDSAWQASRSDAELMAAIRDGRGAMPPFGDVLNTAEIAAAATHVRNLNSVAR